jgi:hypothetical protein
MRECHHRGRQQLTSILLERWMGKSAFIALLLEIFAIFSAIPRIHTRTPTENQELKNRHNRGMHSQWGHSRNGFTLRRRILPVGNP